MSLIPLETFFNLNALTHHVEEDRAKERALRQGAGTLSLVSHPSVGLELLITSYEPTCLFYLSCLQTLLVNRKIQRGLFRSSG